MLRGHSQSWKGGPAWQGSGPPRPRLPDPAPALGLSVYALGFDIVGLATLAITFSISHSLGWRGQDSPATVCSVSLRYGGLSEQPGPFSDLKSRAVRCAGGGLSAAG